MQLSRTERWMLHNQYRILEMVDKQNAESHRHAQEALASGYELYYTYLCEHIAGDDTVLTSEECAHVINILDMFDFMQRAYDNLQDKSGIDPNYLNFPGFDGNNEGKFMGFAAFFCKAREVFEHLRKSSDGFNSHMPTDELYARLLTAWQESKNKRQLTKDDLIRITQASIHPDNRT